LKNCINVNHFGRATTTDITEGEISTIGSLYCDFADTGGAMTTLNGIEFATNLTNLQAINYTLTDISKLSTLPNLNNLYLYNNTIVDATPLSGLVNLQSLEIQNNDITNISPFTNLINLDYLDIRGNEIYLASQLELDVHTGFDSRLGGMYLYDLPSPEEVVIFEDSEMRKCVLNFLFDDPNFVFNITKYDLGLIDSIDCYEPIKIVSDLTHATNIRNLTFWDADFSVFPDFRILPSLRYLAAINSKITNVNPLFLSGMNNLLGVNFRNNLITDMSFLGSINSSNLEEFELGNNLINTIPVYPGLPGSNLQYLDVRNNNLLLDTQSEVVGHNFLINNITIYHYDYLRGFFGISNFSVTSIPKNIVLNSNFQVSTFDFLGTLDIIDTRDTISGNHLSGWNIQAEVTDLVDGSKVIPKNQFSFKNLDSISASGYTGSSSDIIPTTPVSLLSIPIGEGAGIHTIDFSNVKLDVSIPSTTQVGNYSGSMSIQLVTGP
jgi:hypothetical protein